MKSVIILSLAAVASAATLAATQGLSDKFVVGHTGKKFWGTYVKAGNLDKAAIATGVKRDFGAVIPDISWSDVEASQGVFNFAAYDAIVNWASSNGKSVRGSTLVGHTTLPRWINLISDKAAMTSIIQTHISNIVGKYKGKIYAVRGSYLLRSSNSSFNISAYQWDVINEVFDEDGSLQKNIFFNALGEDFIKIAFKAARSVDPQAKLYINDYNLESNALKRTALINLVERVNAEQVLIDGIGVEIILPIASVDPLDALSDIASLGLDVSISGLAIPQASANDYIKVIQACLAIDTCVSISSYELPEDPSWTGTRGILWDAKYNPTTAYTSILGSL